MGVRNTFGLLALAVVLILIAWAFVQLFPARGPVAAMTTFEECAAAGNPIMESYPRQCRSADGQLFVENIQTNQVGTVYAAAPTCVVAGCSNHLCIEGSEAAAGGGVSTCEYRAEYACYERATCARQMNGQCGWTMSEGLQMCLQEPEASESAPQVI